MLIEQRRLGKAEADLVRDSIALYWAAKSRRQAWGYFHKRKFVDIRLANFLQSASVYNVLV